MIFREQKTEDWRSSISKYSIIPSNQSVVSILGVIELRVFSDFVR